MNVAVGDIVKTVRAGIVGKRNRRFKVLRVDRETGVISTVDQHHRFYDFEFDEVEVDTKHRFLTRPLPRWALPRKLPRNRRKK